MRLLYIAARIIQGGYGRLYNWPCVQPQARVVYGYLYNWYAATDARNICSAGWHVPAYTELNYNQSNSLFSFLGGATSYSGKLKETGTTYWDAPNTGATNETGFNGRGSGVRNYDGSFSYNKIFLVIHSTFNYDIYNRQYQICAYNYGSEIEMSGGWSNKTNGCAIRILKDTTTLTNGQTGTYTGNDGKVYKTICIGTQEWVSSDLMETKYRDGSVIPEVTDNTDWSLLTTGGRCSFNNIETNAGTTVSIAPAGWHVPTATDWITLFNEIDTFDPIGYTWPYAGGMLKETGLKHWLEPNLATDDYGFSAFGAGILTDMGDGTVMFGDNPLKENCGFWVFSNDRWTPMVELGHAQTDTSLYWGMPGIGGISMRLIKDDSTWTTGDTLTDIDGNVYPTVKIGAQVWMAKNLKVTKLNDGTVIPNVTDPAEWAALTTMGQCVYDNNEANL